MLTTSRRLWAPLLVLAVVASLWAPGAADATAQYQGRDLLFRTHVHAVHIVWADGGLDIKVR